MDVSTKYTININDNFNILKKILEYTDEKQVNQNIIVCRLWSKLLSQTALNQKANIDEITSFYPKGFLRAVGGSEVIYRLPRDFSAPETNVIRGSYGNLLFKCNLFFKNQYVTTNTLILPGGARYKEIENKKCEHYDLEVCERNQCKCATICNDLVAGLMKGQKAPCGAEGIDSIQLFVYKPEDQLEDVETFDIFENPSLSAPIPLLSQATNENNLEEELKEMK